MPGVSFDPVPASARDLPWMEYPRMAAQDPLNLPTRREWLAERGLAKGQAEPGRRGGGRFSKAAHAELEKARAQGVRFSDDPVARG